MKVPTAKKSTLDENERETFNHNMDDLEAPLINGNNNEEQP